MRKLFVAALMGSAFTMPSLALAQDAAAPEEEGGLTEIVVTAQKREEGLSDVPISISAVTGETLESYGSANLEAVSSSIPNLKITQTAIANRIAIRGIASGDNKGFEQSVAMFVDGIYYGRDQLSRMPLVDLQRIEVLRGPQPTLFGKNAIAGAVNVVSRKPGNDFEGSLSGSYEFEHEEVRLTGVISTPLSEGVGLRVVGYYRTMDGYLFNTRQNREEPDLREAFGRGTLAFDTGGPLTGDLKVEYADFKTKGQPREYFGPVGIYGAVFGPLGVETNEDWVRSDGGYESRNKIFNTVLNAELEMGEHTLTSVSGYLDYSTNETIDVDFVHPVLLDGTRQSEDYRQFSQELRVASPGDQAFNYIAGVYYQNTKLNVTDHVQFNPFFLATSFRPLGDTSNDRDYSQKSDLISAFAQAEFELTNGLRLTAGARYNHEKKSGSRVLVINRGPLSLTPPSGAAISDAAVIATFRVLNIEAHSISGKLSEDSFNPMANIQWDLTDNLMAYGSYAKGTKAGGFDIRGNSLPGSLTVARAGAFEFEDESAENWEVGFKYKTRKLAFNVSYYNTTYKDLQTNVFDGVLNFNVRNASGAKTSGVEADMRWAVDPHLTVSGAVAYLDFKFSDFLQGQCYFQQIPDQPGGLCSYNGKRNALTPKWSGNLNLDWTHELGSSLKLDANLNFDFSTGYVAAANLDPRTYQEGYTKVGARLAIGAADGQWTLALVGRNLTDERIKQTAGALPLATTFTGGRGVAYSAIYDRPRNIALQADIKF